MYRSFLKIYRLLSGDVLRFVVYVEYNGSQNYKYYC